MGSNCCKNALDKVRPPARPSGFDVGDPPDPAAPWPGDTFCRAPAAQAPPVFPEGGFDSPGRFHGSFAPNTMIQRQVAPAEDVPPGSSSLRRRSSMLAGSGSTAVSSLSSQQRQQRTSRASSAEACGVVGSVCPTAGPSSHKSGGTNSSWRTAGVTQGNGGGDAVRSSAAADGTGRLPARLRQALSVSKRRFTSRLRMGSGGRKQETGDAAGDRVGGGGGTAVLSTALLSSADGIFPKDAVDETHFVRYPPSLSPSSECLDPLWPAAAITRVAPAPPPAPATSGTAAAAAREGGREGGDSSGGWTSGSGLASTAVSWNTPVSSSPSAEGGGGIVGTQEETRRLVDAAAVEVGGETAKQLCSGSSVASPAPTKKRSTCGSSSAKDQRWLLKRSKGSSATSSFRAAVEGALPRWKGSKASKERSRTARSRSSSCSAAEGGDWQEMKNEQELFTSGEWKGARCRDNNNMHRGSVRAAVLRRSHRSSASTAAQEEDDYTTAGMEYWWTTSPPNRQEADDEQLTTTDIHCGDFQGALPTTLPIFGEASFTQQRVATTPVRQRQQQLAAGCDVPTSAGSTLEATPAQAQAEVAVAGRAPEASTGLCLGGARYGVGHTTDRLLASSALMHDANSRINTIGSHAPVNAVPAAAEETEGQQPQQSLTNGLRIEPPAASFPGQDVQGYGGLYEYSSGVGSTGSYASCSNNTSSRGIGRLAGSVGNVINGTTTAVDGGSSRRDENPGRGSAWVEEETNPASALDPVLRETAAQQPHPAPYRGQENQNADKSGNIHMPVVNVPFPE